MPDELDGELLRRFVLGDKDAFESLFRQFEIEVFHWILRIIRDASTAEDVLVEAFWRAYRAQARFDPTHSFGAWMRRIATNAARDHLRSVRPHAGWITTSDDIVAPTNTDCASANPSRSRSTLQEFGWSEENEAMAERFTEYLRQKATGIGEAQHQHPFGARYCRRNPRSGEVHVLAATGLCFPYRICPFLGSGRRTQSAPGDDDPLATLLKETVETEMNLHRAYAAEFVINTRNSSGNSPRPPPGPTAIFWSASQRRAISPSWSQRYYLTVRPETHVSANSEF
jgi:RNA polymerase sigma factor (sigma-70 family)